jgi:hypothetical protein
VLVFGFAFDLVFFLGIAASSSVPEILLLESNDGMASRTTAKPQHHPERPRPVRHAPAAVPAAALLSFLKETRELTSWTARDLSRTLNISATDARQALAILQVQGYVKPSLSTPHRKDSKRASKARFEDEWITTPQGEEVSGSRPPRYTRETIARSLDSFADHLRRVNKDASAEYSVVAALAFGDFLSGRPRVQAADVGIRLEPRGRPPDEGSAAE